jgi:hypothetical protein
LVARVAVAAVAIGGLAAFAPAAGASSNTFVCKGTLQSPGILIGNYTNVSVQGVCGTPAGPAHVSGDVVVARHAALVTAFGMHNASLTIGGDLIVEPDGTAIIGCDPVGSPCLDDPSQEHPTLSSRTAIGRNLWADRALGVIAHNSTIAGDVTQSGGGGGVNCNPVGFFAQIGSPAFSTYEESPIGGNARITDMRSCWAGFIREHVGGNVSVLRNQFADPDAMEINDNHISGNLACFGNSMVWDSGDLGPNLFPRDPQPNTVGGQRSGQCVLNSPTSPSDPPGPGPF